MAASRRSLTSRHQKARLRLREPFRPPKNPTQLLSDRLGPLLDCSSGREIPTQARRACGNTFEKIPPLSANQSDRGTSLLQCGVGPGVRVPPLLVEIGPEGVPANLASYSTGRAHQQLARDYMREQPLKPRHVQTTIQRSASTAGTESGERESNSLCRSSGSAARARRERIQSRHISSIVAAAHSATGKVPLRWDHMGLRRDCQAWAGL